LRYPRLGFPAVTFSYFIPPHVPRLFFAGIPAVLSRYPTVLSTYCSLFGYQRLPSCFMDSLQVQYTAVPCRYTSCSVQLSRFGFPEFYFLGWSPRVYCFKMLGSRCVKVISNFFYFEAIYKRICELLLFSISMNRKMFSISLGPQTSQLTLIFLELSYPVFLQVPIFIFCSRIIFWRM
jgi:hypothetical protein